MAAETVQSSGQGTSRDDLIAQWKEIQRAQARAAIFANHELPFSPPRMLGTEPPTSATEPIVRHCAVGAVGDGSGWRGLRTVGGVDISYRQSAGNEFKADLNKNSTNQAIACLAVLSFPELEVLYSIVKPVDLHDTPYIPSFLAFREQSLSALLQELLDDPQARPLPQVVLVDGNGRLHPRQAGSAVSIGVQTGLPTIGVAKEYFPVVPDMSEAEPAVPAELPCAWLATQQSLRAETREILQRRGDWIGLGTVAADTTPPASTDEYLGVALRSSPDKGGTNPVFVSCGHRVGLETALALVLGCCVRARVPEPIRQADKIGRAEVLRVWGP